MDDYDKKNLNIREGPDGIEVIIKPDGSCLLLGFYGFAFIFFSLLSALFIKILLEEGPGDILVPLFILMLIWLLVFYKN